MASYTTDDLLEQIKRKAFVPNSQSTFTDAELLSVATDEIHNTILPAVMSTREEFYVYSQDTEITQVTRQVDIPYRSVGLSLREASFVTGNQERNLPRYDIEDKVYDQVAGSMYGFYIQNNTINLMGSEVGTLRQYYYLRPGKLVVTNDAAQIVSIDSANSVTLSQIPEDWATGTVVDFVNHKAGFDVKQLENTITNITGLVVTFQDDLSAGVAVSNWVTLEDTSPVPQMPIEFFQYLAEAATAYIMESLGDNDGYQRSLQRMQQMMKNAQKTISPRVDGQSKRFVPRRNRGASTDNIWRR
jgi:hypothetical protein